MKLPNSNMSMYLGQLEEKGCIYVKRQEGKNKYWVAVPQLKWLEIREFDTPLQTSMPEWSA
jgi:hypothetical protein